MIYSGGLTDDEPGDNSVYQWVRCCHMSRMPDQIAHHLLILFQTPGVTKSWWNRAFNIPQSGMAKHYKFVKENKSLDDLEDISRNWLSLTRDDIVKLSRFNMKHKDLPLFIKTQVADDYKKGLPAKTTSEQLNVGTEIIKYIRQFGPFWHSTARLPDWFDKSLF